MYLRLQRDVVKIANSFERRNSIVEHGAMPMRIARNMAILAFIVARYALPLDTQRRIGHPKDKRG